MTFASAFSITSRMTQTIARIDPTRAVTPLSSFALSRLRVRRKNLDSVVLPFCAFRGSLNRQAT